MNNGRNVTAPLLLSALCALSCGSKGAVSLFARIDDPRLSVQQAALGAGVSGSFDLVLELGEYASEDTEVSLASFGLVRGAEELIASLDLTPEGDSFPIRVGPGSSKRVTLTFGGGQTYEASLATTLCAGPVKYRGGVTDTASDAKSTPATSAEFTPSCP